jgi:hypothetical protein
MRIEFHGGNMSRQILSGDRVRVEAGDYFGKLGIVVPRRSIEYTHGRNGSIPRIEGATEPLGIHDLLVRLDDGNVVVVPKESLSKILEGEYPLTARVA